MEAPGTHARAHEGSEVSASRRDRARALVAATLPDDAQTLLLGACLWPGDRGDAAWRDWLERTRDPIAALDGARTMMPLLARRAGGGAARDELRTLLKAASVRERSRWQTYRRLAAAALTALASHGVTPVVLKGAALAERVDHEPWLRHCHDVDLLVPRARLDDAAACVGDAGFARLPAADAGPEHVAFAHDSGLPLRLHVEPFLPRAYAAADVFAALAVDADVCGTRARVLPGAASLVHVCGHASYWRGRERLRWVCDAWRIVDRAPDLDWKAVVALAASSALGAKLALPLAVQLEYLAGSLAAPIRADVLAELRRVPVTTADVRAAELGALSGAWRDVARTVARVRPAARVAALRRVVSHAFLGTNGDAAGFPLPAAPSLRRAAAIRRRRSRAAAA